MKKILLFLFCCFIGNTFATDNTVIKEETTPPTAEGPITPAQLPSMTSTTTPSQK